MPGNLKFEFEVEVAGDANGFTGERRGRERPIPRCFFGCFAQDHRAVGVGDPDFAVLIDDRENAHGARDVGASGCRWIGRRDAFELATAQGAG